MNIALNRVSRIPMTAIADGIQRLDMSGLGDTATTQDMVRLFLSLDCYETELLDKMRVRVCVVVFVFTVWPLACVHSTCLTVFCVWCGSCVVWVVCVSGVGRRPGWTLLRWTWQSRTCSTSHAVSAGSRASSSALTS